MVLIGIGLIVGATLLVIVEVLVPSGGLIGLLCAAMAVAGVVLMWTGGGATWGLSGLLGTAVLLPGAFFGALNILPHTPMGRAMILQKSDEEKAADANREREEKRRRDALVGQRGTAVTDMRPSGTVEVGGERYPAQADIQLIDRGATVQVVRAEPTVLRVREVKPAEAAGSPPPPTA